jgi:PAS domain S-box-containing protein
MSENQLPPDVIFLGRGRVPGVNERRGSFLRRYGSAVIAVAAALLLKLLLASLIARESPFTFFLVAVIVSAYYGGVRAGLLATALAVPVIDFFFLEPILTFDFGWASGNSLSLLLFAGEGIAISLLVGWLYSAQNAARLRAEELAASELRYRRIVETSQEGIWIRDEHGDATYVNPRMAQMLGYTVEEILKRPWTDFVRVEDRSAAERFWKRRRQGIIEQYEFCFYRQDGSDLWTIVSSNPIFNEESRFIGALSMLTDVTARKHTEEQVCRAKEELEARVVDRTAELHKANGQLQIELGERRRAEESAEAANRAKSDFLANVSHEIRNPMNVILTAADLLQRTEPTAEQAEYVRMIQTSARSLLSVVNDLLDLSKIEAGKLTLDNISFNLGHCLAKILKVQALRAHHKGLELTCCLDPSLPSVLVGDPNRLGQIITNLVGNAIKFTDRGEVVLRVQAQSQAAQEVTLHITVSDTGIGIPADKLQVIFRPFEQAEPSTARVYGGTGLGLSISAQLAALMSGQIWVESEIGHGTTFHVTVCLELSQSLAAGLVSPQLSELHGVPVLVVDDRAASRRMLEDALYNWHMNARGVGSAREALTILTQAAAAGQPFPLVIIDAHMPEIDGFALAEHLKEQPELAKRAIVLLWSTDGPREVARCRELDIAACLTKPILTHELRDTVLAVMGSGTTRAGNGLKEAPPVAARSLHVLVAEDNAINQVVMMDLLEKLGHTVVTASNGPEVLSTLERQSFDVVLMDLQMPLMSGFEVTARIRERERATGEHLPILAVTALAMKGNRERCLQAGMDAYLAKPFETQDVIDAITRLATPSAATG